MRYKHLLKQELGQKEGEEMATGLERKKIRKMVTDLVHGIHCFFLCENELFYTNWHSKKVHEVRVSASIGIIRSLEIY